MSRRRWMLPALLPGAVLLLLHLGVAAPRHRDAHTEERGAEQAATELAARLRDRDRLQDFRREGYPRLQTLEPVVRALRPADEPPTVILPLLESLAGEAGIELLGCQWTELEPDTALESAGEEVPAGTALLRRIRFLVDAQGSAERLLAFLAALERGQRPISMGSVEMKRDRDPRLPVRLRLTATAVFAARDRSAR